MIIRRSPTTHCQDRGPSSLMQLSFHGFAFTTTGGRRDVDTSVDTEASHQLFDHPIAFEVDQVDEFLQIGWSVLSWETPSPPRRVIAATRRRAGAAALAAGPTSAGRATALRPMMAGPSCSPVLGTIGEEYYS